NNMPSIESMQVFNCQIINSINHYNNSDLELVNSALGVIYGANALSAIINIKNTAPSNKNYSVNYSYGSFNSNSLNLSLAAPIKNIYYLTTDISGLQTDGYNDFSKMQNLNTQIKFGYHNNKTLIELSNLYSKEQTEDLIEIVEWQRDRQNTNLRIYNKIDNLFFSFGLSYTSGIHKSFEILNNYNQKFQSYDFEKSTRLDFYYNCSANLKMQAGAEFTKYGGEIPNQPFAKRGEFYSKDNAVFYLFNFHFIERLELQTGGRYNDNSKYGELFIDSHKLIFKPNQNNIFYFLTEKNFKNPSVFQTQINNFKSNSALLPETLRIYELNYKKIFSKTFNLISSIFKNIGKNHIDITTIPFTNSDKKYIHYGADFFIDYNYKKFENIFGYQYLYSAWDTRLLNKHKFFFACAYNHQKNLKFSIDAQYVNKYYGSAYKQNRMPDFLLLNSAITYKIKEPLILKISVNNILDKNYALMYDEQYGKAAISMPGINIFASLTAANF
ncbi:MAG TPA: TonB-dependent receptor, partial [bacterium]|nr:TonB-dependent receptor [bacterium]